MILSTDIMFCTLWLLLLLPRPCPLRHAVSISAATDGVTESDRRSTLAEPCTTCQTGHNFVNTLVVHYMFQCQLVKPR